MTRFGGIRRNFSPTAPWIVWRDTPEWTMVDLLPMTLTNHTLL
jgi:hypothetical protein